jgi:hypothetical protein
MPIRRCLKNFPLIESNKLCFSLSQLSDEFRSKVACENDVIQLMCNPYSRIAIYGATYGRTEYESLQCAQPSGLKEDFRRKQRNFFSHFVSQLKKNFFYFTACPAAYTTETVMKICHGQRKCSLTADSATFGKPCEPDVRMYLKVVYTCGEFQVFSLNFQILIL